MGYIVTVDLIAHLLPFVTVDGVFFAGRGAVNDVSQIAVQFDRGMLRAGKAATPKNTHGHLKVAPVLLTQKVGGGLRGAEERMKAVVDRHGLIDTIASVGIVESRLELDQRK